MAAILPRGRWVKSSLVEKHLRILHCSSIPVDTQRNNNVIVASKRRHDVVLTS